MYSDLSSLSIYLLISGSHGNDWDLVLKLYYFEDKLYVWMAESKCCIKISYRKWSLIKPWAWGEYRHKCERHALDLTDIMNLKEKVS